MPGFAIQIVRRARRPNGTLTEGEPVNFWHVPAGGRPRDGAYEGLPHVQPLIAESYCTGEAPRLLLPG